MLDQVHAFHFLHQRRRTSSFGFNQLFGNFGRGMLLFLLMLVAGTARAQESDLHGLIEVGGSDIKSVVLQLTRTEIERIERAFNEREEPLKFRMFDKSVRHQFPDEKVSAVRPENMPRVIEALQRTTERMTTDYAVPKERVYIFASSGVAQAKTFADLQSQVSAKLPGLKLQQIDAELECQLTYRWITPRPRYGEVVAIDIGSSNTKACYVADAGRPGQPPRIHGFELLALGTKTFAARVQAELQKRGLDQAKFASVAQELRRGEVRQNLAQALSNNPGLSLPRLYLAGGIVWATSNLVRPCGSDPDWADFKTNDVVILANRLKKGDGYFVDTACASGNTGQIDKIKAVVADIHNTFTPEQLIAGTELLQAMAEQLHFDAKEKIFFAKVARDSWRSQLLADIIRGSHFQEPDAATPANATQIARLVAAELSPLLTRAAVKGDEIDKRLDGLGKQLNDLAARMVQLGSGVQATGPATDKSSCPVGGEAIKIGVAGPMTGSNAALGIQVKNGVEAAADDLNAKCGIGGHFVKVLVGDDQGDPEKAVVVANKMISDGVKIVVGHVYSGAALAAAPIYAKNNVVMITPTATNVKITESDYWNVFRTGGRDDQQGETAGNYILDKLPGKKIAIVHDTQDYGKGLADSTKRILNKNDVTEALYDSVDPKATDMSALVAKLKAANVDVVYFGGYLEQSAQLIKQMRAARVAARLIGGDGLVGAEFVTAGGADVDGTLSTGFPEAEKRPGAKKIVDDFLATRKITPEGTTLYGYAAVEVAAQAMGEANSFDGKTIAKTLHASKSWPTVIGPITYDRKGDPTRSGFVMYTWKKGPDGKIVRTAE